MRLLIALLIAAMSGGALAADVAPEDLTTAFNICESHRDKYITGGYSVGYEQCKAITDAYNRMIGDRRRAEEIKQLNDVHSRLPK